MQPLDVAKAIEITIHRIGEEREKVEPAGQRKAETIAEYDKAVAVAMLHCKMGEGITLEGKLIKDPPVGMIDKLIKGYCYDQRLAMESAEAHYKSVITRIECLTAQLNGFQSIYRHLDAT